jgi:hypothetical protein
MTRYEENRILVLNDPKRPRICPELAREIGLNESIVFLQLEFLIAVRGEWRECNKLNVETCDFKTGPGAGHFHKWVYMSARKAAENEFIWWGKDTVNRTFNALLSKSIRTDWGKLTTALLIEGDYNKLKGDSTRWLTINYTGAAQLKSIRLLNTPSQDATPPAKPSPPSQSDTPPSQDATPPVYIDNPPSQDATPLHEIEKDLESFSLTPPEIKPKRKDARNAEPYADRLKRILRAAIIKAWGYEGREHLLGAKENTQIKDCYTALVKDVLEPNPDIKLTDLADMIEGFGYYWVSGIWWTPSRGEPPRTFDSPSPPSIQKNWIKYEQFSIEWLDGGIPTSVDQLIALRAKVFNGR